MANKRFFIRIFGCQMNVCDGDRLRTAMTARGWEECADAEEADSLIFITCSIRDKAEQKAVSELGRFRASWERHGGPRVALIGCMAQRAGHDAASRFPWVRVVAGPRHIGAVPDAIERAESGELVLLLDEDPRAVDDLACAPTPRANPHKAYVTISHGCDQFCSYCIVPHVRGRFGSRPRGEILAEVETLVSRGALEVTLLGQNVNTWGRDIGETFASLLRDASSVDGLRRLRFVTSHPIDFTDDILEAMTSRAVICPSVNLPAQSGSDKVLAEMNRKYTRAEYDDAIRRIRAALPGCGITTDIIVGFPGETEGEFEETLSLLRETRFDLVHSAAYSPREGTPAARRTDQVPGRERARRLNELNALQRDISAEINAALVGRELEILIDEAAQKGEGLLQGRTDTDKVVLIPAAPGLIGTFRRAEITGSSPWCLEGDIVA